jgi:hypothetical protein
MSSSQIDYQSLVQTSNPTQADWDAINVVVPINTMIIAPDTGVVKIGDGVNTYANLPDAFILGQATTGTPGLVALATLAEALAGSASGVAISPATMGHYVNNAIGSLLVLTDGVNTVNNPVKIIFTNGSTVTPVVTNPTIVQSAIADSGSISLPNPVTVGNLIVCLWTQNGGEPTVPAGWSGAAGDNANWQATGAIYKIAATAEDGTLSTNRNEGNNNSLYMAEIAGGVSVTAYQGVSSSNGSTLMAAAVPITGGALILTTFRGGNDTTYSSPGVDGDSTILCTGNDGFGGTEVYMASLPPESSAGYVPTIQTSGNQGGNAFGILVIEPNVDSISAKIVPGAPVTLNGTSIGNFQGINVVTGGEPGATVANNILTLSLGSPMNVRGAYDTTGNTTYHQNDVVTFNGTLYLCLTATSASPTASPTYWQSF